MKDIQLMHIVSQTTTLSVRIFDFFFKTVVTGCKFEVQPAQREKVNFTVQQMPSQNS